jgi:predicted naringenin-chalcone synthase
VIPKGKTEMSWGLSSTGFLMTLSGYVPELIEEDFLGLVTRALEKEQLSIEDVTGWCIHPGGKRILQAIHKSLSLENGQLQEGYDVLRQFGNMSSPTILFVLKEIMARIETGQSHKLFAAAFGPGLTMETFVATAG